MDLDARRSAPRLLTALFIVLLTPVVSLQSAENNRPNILWLSAEDHGPHLGCYGDTFATTPHLDAFAKRALRYDNAISNAPVCAPARTTIITGMYAPSLGAHHMRSLVPRPAWHRLFTELLRDGGYYCTNSRKTDYNVEWDPRATWDESSEDAHYRNRPGGSRFFAVFNQPITHESRLRNENPSPYHDPARVPIPPYHPDTPEVRKEWAQYYDRLREMDTWFGQHLAELAAAGLVEDTIVFFWADHGSGMPRGKRFAGYSGVHVPLIVHIPEKFAHLRPREYQAGAASSRLVGFVDFAPTVLSLAGIEPPDYHQGLAFLGRSVSSAPEFSFGFRGRMDERPDSSRSVYDGRYSYVRNFMPHLPHGQNLLYQLETATTRVWRQLYRDGKLNAVQSYFWGRKAPEELYDLETDPHETRNLATDPAHRATLLRLRSAQRRHLEATGDLGLFPEGILQDKAAARGIAPGALLQAQFSPLDEISAARDLLLEEFDLPALQAGLHNPNAPSARYWAALSCLYRSSNEALQARDDLVTLLSDSSRGVRIAAAEVLAMHSRDAGTREQALRVLLDHANVHAVGAYHGVAALNALDHIGNLPPAVREAIARAPKKAALTPSRANGYGPRLHKHLFDPP